MKWKVRKTRVERQFAKLQPCKRQLYLEDGQQIGSLGCKSLDRDEANLMPLHSFRTKGILSQDKMPSSQTDYTKITS